MAEPTTGQAMGWDAYEKHLRLEFLQIVEGLLEMPHDGKYRVNRVMGTVDMLWAVTADYRAHVVHITGYNRMMAL